MLRKMIKGGLQRYDEENDFRYKICNKKLLEICNTENVTDFIARQQTKYLAQLVRQSNTTLTKRLLFNENKYRKRGRRTETLCDKVLKITGTNKDQFCKAALKREIGHGHPIGSGRRKLSK